MKHDASGNGQLPSKVWIGLRRSSLMLLLLTAACEPNPCQQQSTMDRVNSIVPAVLAKTGNFAGTVDRKLLQCSYSYSDHVLTTDVELAWNGPVSGNFYAMDGRLRLSDDGSWEWITTAMNPNLQDWTVSLGIINALSKMQGSSN